MILIFRALARLAGTLVLAVLAVGGLAVAVFSLGGGDGDLSLPGLARLVELPGLEDETTRLLGAVEAGGPVALSTALAAAGAIALGLVLLTGALVPPRERLVRLGDGLRARRRPLASALAQLASQAPGAQRAKVRVRPRRCRDGGRARVRVAHARSRAGADVQAAAEQQLATVTSAFALRPRVRARASEAVE